MSSNNYLWNEFKNQLTIPNKVLPNKNEFEIKFEKATFINIESDTNVVFQQKFERQDLENYGSLEGKIIKPKKNTVYIIELINSLTNEIEQFTKTNESYKFKYVEPGLYIIRAIEDNNGNGKWDIGNYLKNEKPENIFFMEGKLKVKANFEITDLFINTEN